MKLLGYQDWSGVWLVNICQELWKCTVLYIGSRDRNAKHHYWWTHGMPRIFVTCCRGSSLKCSWSGLAQPWAEFCFQMLFLCNLSTILQNVRQCLSELQAACWHTVLCAAQDKCKGAQWPLKPCQTAPWPRDLKEVRFPAFLQLLKNMRGRRPPYLCMLRPGTNCFFNSCFHLTQRQNESVSCWDAYM